jgi:hypothetical protein
MADRPNTPVPDELAAIRAQLKELTAREEVLRGLLLDNPDLRTGADYLAEIKVTKQARTDLKELRASHPDIVEQFTFPVEITRIVLSGIDADTGEITSLRRRTA